MVADAFVLRDDLPNEDILDAIRGITSTDYSARIPSATQAGVAATIDALMDPSNRRWRNEFIDALVNRIGLVIARANSWTNPLAPFKRGMLAWGNTIEEIQVGLLRAHNYSPDSDYMEKTLFGRETPEVQTNFHTVNRQNFYKVTVNEALLQRAFLEPNGLSAFVNQLMEAPSTSDQLDEFLLTCSLFPEYEANGGYYHVRVPDVSDFGSSAEDAKLALRKMRAMADTLKFLSTKYNAAKMPTFAKPDELLLFVSPEFNAAVDVEALAGAFNIDRANMHGRTIVLPQEHFGVNHCQAIMTTAEFFVIADEKFETTSQYNAANLHNNYFLHRWQVVSCSRFAPAVMFSTELDDEVINVHTAPTSLAAITILPDADGTVPTGITHGGVVALASSVVPDGANQGIRWSITGNPGNGTFITQDGVLHLGALDPIASGSHYTVVATSTDIDPDIAGKAGVVATLDVDVLDAPLTTWPATGSVIGISVAGENVPAFAAGTTTYDINVPAGTAVNPSDVFVESNGPVSVNVTVDGPNAAAPQWVAHVATQDVAGGSVTTYTVNVTEV